MKSLLRADFARVRKDKLLLIMGIISAGLALLNVLINAGMLLMLNDSGVPEEILSGFLYAKGLFFGSFTVGNNMGLIAPVLLAIVLCKDFSYGTIRNKIIAGKSRSAIFMSLFITCSVVYIGVILINAVVTLGVGLVFFEYQAEAFTFADLGYTAASLGIALLSCLFVSAMLSWLCAGAKNVGVAIVLNVVFAFVLSMIYSITQMAVPMMEVMGTNETTISIVRFIERINIAGVAPSLGANSTFTLEDVMYLMLPSLLGITAFLLLGLRKFNKKDLK